MLNDLITGGVWVNAWREYQTVGNGAILEDCTGNEIQPFNCTYSMNQFERDCDHLDDAGIRCQGRYPLTSWVHIGHFPYVMLLVESLFGLSPSDSVAEFHCPHLTATSLPDADEPACDHGNVRLVGGTAREGIVQLCVYGVWGPLSSNDWRFEEASVVCRSLGYNDSGTAAVIHC